VNKLLLLILILLFTNNCSVNKKKVFWDKLKNNPEEVKKVEIILSKKNRKEGEFNPTLKINVSGKKFRKKYNNNQNNTGELSYMGDLENIGKYKFSRFDNFEYIDVMPVFYNENVLFFNNKGTILFYDQNQKIIWKKNYYSKSEKKIKPILNFARQNNILIVTDNMAKYYAINIDTGEMIWSKNNSVSFNSDIKIKDNIFYAVDHNNVLRSISIDDGSELWNLKTEESITKSNTKISVVVKGENIYFSNTIGDITAVNIKSGQLVWQLPTQNNNIIRNAFQLSNSKLVINKKSIYFSNNKNEFYSIDLETGLINWINEINSSLKPVIVGKYIITISDKGYLYIADKQTGNIIRVNDLYQDYKIKRRKNIYTTGFFVARNKIYLSSSDGKLIIVDLNTGIVLNTIKVSGNKILQPYFNNDNLFLITNGSIIKYN